MELGVPSLMNNELSLGIKERDPAWQDFVMDVLTDKYERKKKRRRELLGPSPNSEAQGQPALLAV